MLSGLPRWGLRGVKPVGPGLWSCRMEAPNAADPSNVHLRPTTNSEPLIRFVFFYCRNKRRLPASQKQVWSPRRLHPFVSSLSRWSLRLFTLFKLCIMTGMDTLTESWRHSHDSAPHFWIEFGTFKLIFSVAHRG